jgi:Cupin domain.
MSVNIELAISQGPRRVVSASDNDGQSRVAFDGRSLPSLEVAGVGSTTFYNVWRAGPAGQLPFRLGATDPATDFADMTKIFPETGGSHVTISIWPASYPPENSLPQWMHATNTVDYIFILAGEITCFFDSGDRVTLAAGDCLVQNGTQHAWRNEGLTPCVMAAVAVGVRPAGELS